MLNRRTLLSGVVASAALAAIPESTRGATPPVLRLSYDSVDPRHRRSFDMQWANNVGQHSMGRYEFRSDTVQRPFFSNLALPYSATQLTRNHPPKKDDASDHADMHPGLWLAFGDINGHDFWRNKARVVHEKFLEEPHVAGGLQRYGARFSSLLRYETAGGAPIARETFSCRLQSLEQSRNWRLDWDSTIEALDEAIVFGDQEEMGLGLRLATDLTVKNGGAIENSHGDKNERGCWGKTAEWCRYYARRNERDFGWLVIPHPDNFKPCSFHVRDYGLLVANPFAEKAFGRSEKPAQTVIKPDESLRLRFGIVAFSASKFDKFDPATEAKRYVEATKG